MEICELHGQMSETVNRIEAKIDNILDRQVGVVRDIQYIKDTVDNGLKSKVEETATDIKVIKDRITVMEGFSWFAEWVTDIRNNLFKNTLKLAVIGGGIYIVIHFGDKIIVRVLG